LKYLTETVSFLGEAFVHRLIFLENTMFRKPALLPSSGKVVPMVASFWE